MLRRWCEHIDDLLSYKGCYEIFLIDLAWTPGRDTQVSLPARHVFAEILSS